MENKEYKIIIGIRNKEDEIVYTDFAYQIRDTINDIRNQFIEIENNFYNRNDITYIKIKKGEE